MSSVRYRTNEEDLTGHARLYISAAASSLLRECNVGVRLTRQKAFEVVCGQRIIAIVCHQRGEGSTRGRTAHHLR